MDPNETRHELTELGRQVLGGEVPHDMNEDTLYRMAELATQLDEWLSRGGFLPSDWDVSPARKSRP